MSENYHSFTEAYHDLVERTYRDYDHESSPRDMKVRENLFESFTITNPRDRLLFVPARKFSLQYVMAEILWYLSGNNETSWINDYSQFWKNISDDGTTANSAYGARIFKKHPYQLGNILVPSTPDSLSLRHMPEGWSQWQYVVDELSRDPDSRRAVIHIRMPQDSYLASLDVPCTLTLQFFVRDKKLHMVTQMRSNDLILGTALDVPAFTFMQELLALELGVGLGSYHHTSNSLHVYERHFAMCEEILASEPQVSTPMPPLRGKPPVQELMDLEKRGRQLNSSSQLVELGNEARLLGDPMWTDWAHILLAHRAKKMKDPELESWFMSGLALECFRRCA